MFGVKIRYTKHRFKMMLFQLAADKLDEVNNVGANGEQENAYTEDQLLQALDLIDPSLNFLHHQWELYKSNIRAPLAKKLSEQGKKAKSMQVHTHRTGATSFARKRDRFKTKHKRSPNRIEVFDMTYKSKDGSYIHDMSRKFMEQAREEMTKRELEIGKSRVVDDDVRAEIADAVMFELMGPDKPGQALGYGTGVTKSKVTKLSTDLRRSRKESLITQKGLLLEKIESQGRKIELQDNQMKIMAKDLSDIRGELNVLMNAFKELCVSGASIDHQETSQNIQEEDQQEHQHNLPNLWQNLWQSSMQTPSGIQNHQVAKSSQGKATRQHQSVSWQQRHEQNPLIGQQQYGYSDMQQD